MAESIIGLFKTELIRRKGPWRGLDTVEMATLEWVDWFNNRRVFSAIGNIPQPRPKPTITSQQHRLKSFRWQNKLSTESGAVQLGA
jgi:putative transposase